MQSAVCLAYGEQGIGGFGGNTVLKKKKLIMFLETEGAFPYCNWLIKMARVLWPGLTSVR